MRLFRRIPTPFAISYLFGGLIHERIQKRKADKYANQVVHYYDTTIDQHIEEVRKKQESERALINKLLYSTPEEQKEALLQMNERDKEKYNP